MKGPTAVYHQRAIQTHVQQKYTCISYKYTLNVLIVPQAIVATQMYLHPEEESFGARFKFQHINSSCRALIHPFELTVVGKNDQILNEGELTFKIKQ